MYILLFYLLYGQDQKTDLTKKHKSSTMKIMSKKNYSKLALFLIICIVGLYSCKTTQQNQTVQHQTQETEEKVVVLNEPDIIILDADPVNILAEPEISVIPPKTQAEYTRSVSELKGEVVTQDVFEKDKKTILRIIDELSDIMIKKDYRKWINYISPQSLKYWQNSNNLEAVSARLPIKGVVLKNLEDYFRLIFIPSRLNVTVDEIRYTSVDTVKVVQVRGEQDIICYYFEKINGEWMLILDTL